MIVQAERNEGSFPLRALANFVRGSESFSKTKFSLEPREELIGDACDVTVVYRENGDVIFQLFPKTRNWPADVKAGRELLGELLETYFDKTEGFSGAYAPELKSWAILATRLALTLTYDKEHHVYGFARFLNQALVDL